MERLSGMSRRSTADEFATITRSQSHPATNEPDEIVKRAIALIEQTEAGRRPIRLLGVSVHNFESMEGPGEVDSPQLRLEA